MNRPVETTSASTSDAAPHRAARVALFHAPGRAFEHRTVDVPMLEPGELLCDVAATTLCGSDLHSVRGARSVPVPTVLGHEILGRIREFGPDSPRVDFTGSELQIGDRVSWAIVAACGKCRYCQRGIPQKCTSGLKYGHESASRAMLSGGLADQVILARNTAVFRVPDELSDAVVCPVNCATATVEAADEAAGELRNRAILIVGAGMLGLTACRMVKSLGAELVLVIEPDAQRRRLAIEFGADAAEPPECLPAMVSAHCSRHGVDVVLELSGRSAAIEAAIPHVAIGGTVVLVGAVFPGPAISILPEMIVRRLITIRGVHNYGPKHLGSALRFLTAARNDAPWESLVSPWHSLADVDAAIQTAATGRWQRVGIRPAGA